MDVDKKYKTLFNLKEVSPWFPNAELGHFVALVDALWQRELDLRIMELFHRRSAAVSSFNCFHSDDLDRVGTCSVTSTHVPVTLGHSAAHTQVTVFPVHVVRTRPRVVTQPNSKVLDFGWRLFGNLKLKY